MEGYTPHHEEIRRAGKLRDEELRRAAAQRELVAEARRAGAGSKRRSGLGSLRNRLRRRTR